MKKNSFKLIFFTTLSFVYFFLFVSFSFAAVLHWDIVQSNEDCTIAGYNVHITDEEYTQVVDVGNVNSFDLDWLDVATGQTYFLAVNAYSSQGVEGRLSVSISYPSTLQSLITYYRDTDGDGYGNPDSSTEAEVRPSGYVTDNTDCNDNDNSIHPGASEIRGDGIDQDCNGGDLPFLITYYRDTDGDGYGNPYSSTEAEVRPAGYVTDNTDCNDNDNSIHPGASEIRGDGIDQDCDGSDRLPFITFYRDGDGDGYGDPGSIVNATYQMPGYVTDNTDCNDNDSSIHPGAVEIDNDGVDHDCNGSDLQSLITYYQDNDHDGYGNSENMTESATQPSGYVTDNTDCNDNDNNIHPGASDIRGDGIDQDCNGEDLPSLTTYYRDIDGDGYGNPNSSTKSATQPSGYVTDNTDCNDNDNNIYPGASDIRGDGIDQDCNGEDLPSLTTYYRDIDGDGYGNPDSSTKAATQPSGYVTDNTDCNDNENSIHPGATDYCNGKDDNCNGVTDEACDVAPNKTTLTLPLGITENITPSFTWDEVSNATWYKIYIRNTLTDYRFSEWYEIEDNFPDYAEAACSGGKCTVTLDFELKIGDYKWYVESWNDYGNVWSDEMGFTVHDNDSPPSKAFHTSPSGLTADLTPAFTWDEVSNATWYKIYLRNTLTDSIFVEWYEIEDNFPDYAEAACSGGKCTVTLDFELKIGNYEWYIKSWNDYGNVWSDGMGFIVQNNDNPPSKAFQTSPSGLTADSTPAFTWDEASNATWYKIYIRNMLTDSRFVEWYEIEDNFPDYAETACSGGKCTVTLDFELKSGNYNWYVESWNNYGRVWSDGMSFTVTD